MATAEEVNPIAGVESEWIFDTVFLLFLLPFFAITNT
jgi:hypothetical protein